jgi:hypothetical protein
MSADEDPPLKTESPRQRTEGQNQIFRPIDTSHEVGKQARPQCRCVWLENYLGYIERLNCQSGCEPLSTRALAIAMRRYGTFCRSCLAVHRRDTWKAVQRAVALLS